MVITDISINYNNTTVHQVTVCPCGFMNNIVSGTKYRVSPEGVSLMDETNNLASHLERFTLIHNYGYAHFGRPGLRHFFHLC